ncbi:MAG: hypothetical protein RL434_1407 [Pseudomonadota bacterium]
MRAPGPTEFRATQAIELGTRASQRNLTEMSSNHHDDAQQDANFIRTFAMVLGIITLIGVGIVFLARGVTENVAEEKGAYTEGLETRIAPVGQLNTSGAAASVAAAGAPPAPAAEAAAAPAATPVALSGKEVYDSVCFACHTPGAAGAPKFGDAAAWAPRVAQGVDTLYKHSIEGYMGNAGMMPPKGGRPDLADEAVKAAVDYMVENSK